MSTVEHDLPAQPANNETAPKCAENTSASPRRKPSSAETPIIVDTLRQCAATFGIERARFMRQLPAGEWVVHTLHQDSMTSHTADQAEIAMAWMVGLSRFPIRVTRPRVTQPDGSGIRPIAMTSYLGIPVLCQNRFAGVIELAGSFKGNLERTLDLLSETLVRLGYCLIHDPSIRGSQHIDLDVECGLDGGFWSPNEITLGAEEWTVLSAMGPPTVLRDVASTLPYSDGDLIDVVQGLVSRGLVSVRAAPRTLSEKRDSPRVPAGVSLNDGGQ